MSQSKKPRPPRPKNRPAPPKAPRKKNLGADLTDNPRLAAFRVLKECAASGRPPEDILAREGLLLSPRDLGLATALVYEVLRHKSYLDWLMKSRLASGRAGDELALILRLGLAQLLYFQRLGDHAIVSETVALAKLLTPGRHGLVNAILRGLLREKDSGGPWPPLPGPGGDAVGRLALIYSHPLWLVKKIHDLLGPAETEALLAANNRPTPPTLRLNPARTDLADLQAKLIFPARPTRLSPWGLAVENFAGRPEQWPGYDDGLFSLQDEASQLGGLIAGSLPPGSTILDACCGLGGKSLLLAGLNPQAVLVARDKDPAKLERLLIEARRLGCENITCEAKDLLADEPSGALFDLVLVDAPCSGLGVIRRRPDLKWNKNKDDLPRLAELQRKLLSAAAREVRPGGRLLYGVCTFSPEEGPQQAENFLKEHSGFAPAPVESWPESLRPLLSPAGNLTLFPHRHNTDGFFWAMYVRT